MARDDEKQALKGLQGRSYWTLIALVVAFAVYSILQGIAGLTSKDEAPQSVQSVGVEQGVEVPDEA